MRLSTLVVASAFAWVLVAGAAHADSPEPVAAALEGASPGETAPQAPDAVATPGSEELADGASDSAAGDAAAEAPPEAAWEDFEDPAFDPTDPVEAEPVVVSHRQSAGSSGLGPVAVDEHGVVGRIHTVVSGDTLWDISEAYLGTPWVWPSVWDENQVIANPHVIEPGDRIWITSSEMRIVSDDEADQMIANVPGETEVGGELEFLPEQSIELEDDPLLAEVPASVGDESELPVAIPLEPMAATTGEIIVLPHERLSHYATARTIEEAAQIIDAPTLRAFLTQGDRVYVNLGEGQVEVGDEFTIFREVQKIRDVDTRAVLGYHFDELGWLSIVSVEGEASIGLIKGASGEMERSDHLVPREHPPREIPVRVASDVIEGSIVFTPGYRWLIGSTDVAILNVGSIHGVEVGTKMEVFDAGFVKSRTQMPDTVIAQLVVISIEPESCVAFVAQTVRELQIGDTVRGVLRNDRLALR